MRENFDMIGWAISLGGNKTKVTKSFYIRDRKKYMSPWFNKEADATKWWNDKFAKKPQQSFLSLYEDTQISMIDKVKDIIANAYENKEILEQDIKKHIEPILVARGDEYRKKFYQTLQDYGVKIIRKKEVDEMSSLAGMAGFNGPSGVEYSDKKNGIKKNFKLSEMGAHKGSRKSHIRKGANNLHGTDETTQAFMQRVAEENGGYVSASILKDVLGKDAKDSKTFYNTYVTGLSQGATHTSDKYGSKYLVKIRDGEPFKSCSLYKLKDFQGDEDSLNKIINKSQQLYDEQHMSNLNDFFSIFDKKKKEIVAYLEFPKGENVELFWNKNSDGFDSKRYSLGTIKMSSGDSSLPLLDTVTMVESLKKGFDNVIQEINSIFTKILYNK